MNKFYRRPRQIPKDQLQRTLYFAYGMNTNHDEMSMRCPDSTFIRKATLRNHKLTFQHVADYTYAKGYILHGALWLISANDQKALDRLEGYQNHYTKNYVMLAWMGRKPNSHYENCLRKGYEQSGMKLKQIDRAVKHATEYSIKKQAELQHIDFYDTEYQESIEDLDFTNNSYVPVRERIKWLK